MHIAGLDIGTGGAAQAFNDVGVIGALGVGKRARQKIEKKRFGKHAEQVAAMLLADGQIGFVGDFQQKRSAERWTDDAAFAVAFPVHDEVAVGILFACILASRGVDALGVVVQLLQCGIRIRKRPLRDLTLRARVVHIGQQRIGEDVGTVAGLGLDVAEQESGVQKRSATGAARKRCHNIHGRRKATACDHRRQPVFAKEALRFPDGFHAGKLAQLALQSFAQGGVFGEKREAAHGADAARAVADLAAVALDFGVEPIVNVRPLRGIGEDVAEVLADRTVEETELFVLLERDTVERARKVFAAGTGGAQIGVHPKEAAERNVEGAEALIQAQAQAEEHLFARSAKAEKEDGAICFGTGTGGGTHAEGCASPGRRCGN